MLKLLPMKSFPTKLQSSTRDMGKGVESSQSKSYVYLRFLKGTSNEEKSFRRLLLVILRFTNKDSTPSHNVVTGDTLYPSYQENKGNHN